MKLAISYKPMLNCNDTAQLISLAQDHRMGLWRRLQLRLHNMVCETCRGYEKFVQSIGQSLRADKSLFAMPASAKRVLRVRIQKAHPDFRAGSIDSGE
jgi:hypothetical protein